MELILRDAEATALLVTHDQEEALSLADRVAVMRDGEIVQVGPPVEVYGEPATRWAAQFVGEVNVLSGVARGGGVETELGVFDLRAPASGSVHVAVRPEQLELRADGNTNAEVVAREFRGHDVLYRLRHEGGKTLLVQLPSLELHEVGDSVFVRPAPAAVTALVRLGSLPPMKLYVCWGTFRSPRPGGHPCRNAHEALRDAGWNPEVEKVYGLGILGDALNPTRRKVRRVSGQNMVPVLVTDEEEVISGSDKIAKWARDNPATASDRS